MPVKGNVNLIYKAPGKKPYFGARFPASPRLRKGGTREMVFNPEKILFFLDGENDIVL
jgi:hypothetical protein